MPSSQIRQNRDSFYDSHIFSLGSYLSRNDLDVSLEESGARCESNGLFMPKGRQHMDHHTRIDRLVPDCSSSELYKGILADSSRGVFNGEVYVHPDAQRSPVFQCNANVHREVHFLSEQSTLAYEPARRKIQRFFNARSTPAVFSSSFSGWAATSI